MTTLIAGGGVAGAAAAALLGPDATLVERTPGPHDKVCGEFLSAEAVAYLRRLDLDPAALGAAPIHTVRLVHGATLAEARLPFAACGLSRRVLDEALLARAAAAGATILRGHAVTGTTPGAVSVDRLGPIPCRRLLLATGKHDLRPLRRRPARAPENLVGLKLHLALDPAQARALEAAVEIILFPGGYAGLQRIEGAAANLCLLIRRTALPHDALAWPALQAHLAALAPHLAQRLHQAQPLWPRPLAIYRVPYGYVQRPAHTPPGIFRLGDQAAVIPSFSGDGVSLALHTAFLAASHDAATEFHATLRRQVHAQVARAGTLYQLGRQAPALLTAAARLWPGALRWAARLTRIPAPALLT